MPYSTTSTIKSSQIFDDIFIASNWAYPLMFDIYVIRRAIIFIQYKVVRHVLVYTKQGR